MSDQMTTGAQSPSSTEAAKSAAADTAGTAAEQSKAVAGTAAAQAKDVVADAKGQLGTVTSEAKGQAQKVMSTATSDLESQLEQRLSKASEAARTKATQLRALADGNTEEAGPLVDLIRQAGDRLENLAGRSDELGLRGVAEEVSEFARRRPAAFLLGAAAAGVLVGRMARAGKELNSSSGQSTGGPSMGGGPATPELAYPGVGVGIESPIAVGGTGPLAPDPGVFPTAAGTAAGPGAAGTGLADDITTISPGPGQAS
ncbi:MAG TPA: hypothetical protein VHK88_12075 [Aquihabitans sp.]|jgi:vacuolar-type H+-ATPase subunit H|nr:hypothetical protein [Aquihabitans sp.]